MKKLLIIFPLILLFFTIVFVIDEFNFLEENDISSNESSLSSNNSNLLEGNYVSISELEHFLSGNKNIFVYFYQTDCIHCKNTTPTITSLTNELGIDLKVINLQEEPAGWKKFSIDGTPTIIHYKNGKESSRILGQETEEKFREFFKNI